MPGIMRQKGGDFMREKNILHILRDSRYTVVLSGAGLMAESGYPLLRDGEESYEIETTARRVNLIILWLDTIKFVPSIIFIKV